MQVIFNAHAVQFMTIAFLDHNFHFWSAFADTYLFSAKPGRGEHTQLVTDKIHSAV